MNAEPIDDQQRMAHGNTLVRLSAIEDHLHQIETRLDAIGEFNARLDGIHTILETVIRFVTPDQINQSLTESVTRADGSTTEAGFRVVAHVRRADDGTQLVSDVPWPDAWSVRLFVTALLRTLTRRHDAQERRCWCEVWTPDENGEFVDSGLLCRFCGCLRRCRAACGAVPPRSRAPSASLRDGARATLDL